MTNPNLTQSILHRVADDHLQPKPRWQFISKQILIWLGVLVSIIIGGIASSILAFLIVNNDWEVYDSINNNLINFIILTIPYFWLIIFVGFIILGYFYIRRTKHGYRYRLWQIAATYLVLCFILGGAALAYGGSQEIDRLLTENVPVYKRLVNQQTVRWQQPQLGLLAGDVENVDLKKQELTIEDSEDHSWKIDYSKAKINHQVKLEKEARLELIGIKNDDDHFMAKKILLAKPTFHKKIKKSNKNR